MTLEEAAGRVLSAQKDSGKPLAVVLAGHNGSGKSTMWYTRGLADKIKIPLVNADRMMLSILPENLPAWAKALRDTDTSWMKVAQKGVEAFMAHAMSQSVSFAMETVFSHWRPLPNGGFESKIDLLKKMQAEGYFVLLFFVGLDTPELSLSRVRTRMLSGGHAVPEEKLFDRFPRTQTAIQHALAVADASILVDNSGEAGQAFTVCRVQTCTSEIFDCRTQEIAPRQTILQWLNVVAPR